MYFLLIYHLDTIHQYKIHCLYQMGSFGIHDLENDGIHLEVAFLAVLLDTLIMGSIKWPVADDASNAVIWVFNELVPA